MRGACPTTQRNTRDSEENPEGEGASKAWQTRRGGGVAGAPGPGSPAPPYPPHASAGEQVGDPFGRVVLLGDAEDLAHAAEGHLHGGAGQGAGSRPKLPPEHGAGHQDHA